MSMMPMEVTVTNYAPDLPPDEIEQAADTMITATQPHPSPRRQIVRIDISIPESDVIKKVISHLGKRGFDTDDTENRVFNRGGMLVCVADCDGQKIIKPLSAITIRERITAAMDIVTRGEKGDELRRPPAWLYQGIHDRPEFPEVKRLKGIIYTPTMRPDGSLLQQPGYDERSQLIFQPDGEFPIVQNQPTIDDAKCAAAELLDVVQDFPFKGEPDKSVWLSMVLTLVGRAAIAGGCPLYAFDSNVRGAGKGKLCDIATLIVHGRPIARMALPSDDTETRKCITAIAIESKTAVLFDNAAAMIGSASLDAVLTSTTWSDRILGQSKTTGDLPWQTVLMTTGNNLSFKADTSRRVALCELESFLENPEDRENFQHADIEFYVQTNRHKLAVAALTILVAYTVAGRPFMGKTMASFVPWSKLILGAIRWLGLPDPMLKAVEIRDRDRGADTLLMILTGLAAVAGAGISSKQIVDGISSTEDKWEPLRTAFAELTDKPTARAIGNHLRRCMNRVCRGQRIVQRPGRSNLKLWLVEDVFVHATGDPLENHMVESASTSFHCGSCDHCGGQLTCSQTTDGYLNRYCEACELDHSCIPLDH